MKKLYHFINGVEVEGKSGRFGPVYNPATGEQSAEVPFASLRNQRCGLGGVSRVAFVGRHPGSGACALLVSFP